MSYRSTNTQEKTRLVFKPPATACTNMLQHDCRIAHFWKDKLQPIYSRLNPLSVSSFQSKKNRKYLDIKMIVFSVMMSSSVRSLQLFCHFPGSSRHYCIVNCSMVGWLQFTILNMASHTWQHSELFYGCNLQRSLCHQFYKIIEVQAIDLSSRRRYKIIYLESVPEIQDKMQHKCCSSR